MFYSGKLGNILLKLLVTTLLRRTGYCLKDVIEILQQNEVESAPEIFFFVFQKVKQFDKDDSSYVSLAVVYKQLLQGEIVLGS
jgi:hypothetical protein